MPTAALCFRLVLLAAQTDADRNAQVAPSSAPVLRAPSALELADQLDARGELKGTEEGRSLDEPVGFYLPPLRALEGREVWVFRTDGTRLSGLLSVVGPDEIRVDTANGTVRLAPEDVVRVTRLDEGSAALPSRPLDESPLDDSGFHARGDAVETEAQARLDASSWGALTSVVLLVTGAITVPIGVVSVLVEPASWPLIALGAVGLVAGGVGLWLTQRDVDEAVEQLDHADRLRQHADEPRPAP